MEQSSMNMVKTIVIKRTVFFTIILSSMLLIGGCWDRAEMNDLAIVTATGIDKSDDGKIELTLQIIIPKSMSGGGQSGGSITGAGEGQTTMIVYHKGKNMADALSKIQAEVSRKIFWGACKVYIFSEEAAKAGIQDHLDFLLRHPEPRERAYALVSKQNAKEVIEIQSPLESYSAAAIHQIANLGHGFGITLQDLDEMLMARDREAYLPYVTIKTLKSQDKNTQLATLHGIAIFREDKMIEKMGEEPTRGLLWIAKKIKEYTITIRLKGSDGELSINPASTKVKMTPQIKGGEWKMVIDIHAEGSAVQNSTNLDLFKRDSLKEIEQAFGKMVEDRIAQTIHIAQDMKADFVHFGEGFRNKYPKEWKKVANRWEEVFPDVKVEFHVNAHIQRAGYLNEPVRLEEGK